MCKKIKSTKQGSLDVVVQMYVEMPTTPIIRNLMKVCFGEVNGTRCGRSGFNEVRRTFKRRVKLFLSPDAPAKLPGKDLYRFKLALESIFGGKVAVASNGDDLRIYFL